MSKRRLLLADDSITIQKVVNLTFADEGIEVITFGNGDAAVESIDDVQPDIVLADVNMPGLSGYQICEVIRGNEGTKHVPVVLLVGSFEPFDKEEADRVGADGYLTKPFSSIAELVATVNNLLENGTPPADDVSEAKQPDTADIDNLYTQSFVETVEIPQGDDLGVEFGDDGIDDEMIETSYADSDIDSLANASFFDPDEIDEFIEGPESTTELKASGFGEVQLEESVEKPAELYAVSDDAGDSVNDTNSMHSFSSAETLSFEKRDTASDNLRFDELDLLELPEIPNGKSYEFVSVEQAADAGSNTQVVSLSPELIELIVQKVVEKLAEKY